MILVVANEAMERNFSSLQHQEALRQVQLSKIDQTSKLKNLMFRLSVGLYVDCTDNLDFFLDSDKYLFSGSVWVRVWFEHSLYPESS